jgi:hypothetical protein
MEWSFVRKLKVIGIVSGIVIGLFFLIFWKVLFPVPTCFDGKRNGDERGEDCGGACALYCASDMRDIRVLSARAFPIATGVIHAAAFLEQTNREAGVRSVSYEFTFFDSEGKEITRRMGSSSFGAFGKFVITETLIEVPSIPTYTTFRFVEAPIWERIPAVLAYSSLTSKNAVSTSYPLGTRVNATIENSTTFNFKDTPVTVLVYGNDGNVQAISTTKIGNIPAGGEVPVIATWPFRFREPVSKIEILPLINPFTAVSL